MEILELKRQTGTAHDAEAKSELDQPPLMQPRDDDRPELDKTSLTRPIGAYRPERDQPLLMQHIGADRPELDQPSLMRPIGADRPKRDQPLLMRLIGADRPELDQPSLMRPIGADRPKRDQPLLMRLVDADRPEGDLPSLIGPISSDRLQVDEPSLMRRIGSDKPKLDQPLPMPLTGADMPNLYQPSLMQPVDADRPERDQPTLMQLIGSDRPEVSQPSLMRPIGIDRPELDQTSLMRPIGADIQKWTESQSFPEKANQTGSSVHQPDSSSRLLGDMETFQQDHDAMTLIPIPSCNVGKEFNLSFTGHSDCLQFDTDLSSQLPATLARPGDQLKYPKLQVPLRLHNRTSRLKLAMALTFEKNNLEDKSNAHSFCCSGASVRRNDHMEFDTLEERGASR